mmetsp:Transcript_18789/g.24796  ORF Transcript_18789/g.24796 Transcript_18789/m.24796 type:complete len:115 (+) Transcript_18789:760-1104(+)
MRQVLLGPTALHHHQLGQTENQEHHQDPHASLKLIYLLAGKDTQRNLHASHHKLIEMFPRKKVRHFDNEDQLKGIHPNVASMLSYEAYIFLVMSKTFVLDIHSIEYPNKACSFS